METVKTWMHTDPLTAEKYVRRVEKVKKIDAEHTVAVK
jgi:ribose 5-phosphate isomerase B